MRFLIPMFKRPFFLVFCRKVHRRSLQNGQRRLWTKNFVAVGDLAVVTDKALERCGLPVLVAAVLHNNSVSFK